MVSYHSHIGIVRVRLCYFVTALPIVVFLLLSLFCILSINLVPRNFTQMTVASFVVDCNPQYPEALFLYNSITFSQQKDQAIGMEVFSVPRGTITMNDDVQRQSYTDFSGTNERMHRSHPWYCRPGSNISLDLMLSYNDKPDDVIVFFLRAQTTADYEKNYFESEPTDYLYRGTFAESSRIQVNRTVTETGAYFLFTYRRGGGTDVSIQGSIVYYYKYINREDYVDVTDSVRQDDDSDVSFDVRNNQVVLCNMSEQVHQGPFFTDISLEYDCDYRVHLPVMIIPLVFLVISTFGCFAYICYRRKRCDCCCLVCYRHCRTS